MTEVYEIAWAPELQAELDRLLTTSQQNLTQERARELREDSGQWEALQLRYRGVLDYAKRCQADPTLFSATPLGLEKYVLSLMVLRPYLRDDQQEWISEKIKVLLTIAEETREARVALMAAQPDDATPQ